MGLGRTTARANRVLPPSAPSTPRFLTDVRVGSVDAADAPVDQQLRGVRGHQLVSHENLPRRWECSSVCVAGGVVRGWDAEKEVELRFVRGQIHEACNPSYVPYRGLAATIV